MLKRFSSLQLQYERGRGVRERERVGVDHAGSNGGEVVGEEGAGGGAGGAVHGAVGGALAACVPGELREQANAARADRACGLRVEQHDAAALAQRVGVVAVVRSDEALAGDACE